MTSLFINVFSFDEFLNFQPFLKKIDRLVLNRFYFKEKFYKDTKTLYLINLGYSFYQETEKWIVSLALAPLLKYKLITEEEKMIITNWFLSSDPFKTVPSTFSFIKYYSIEKHLFCLSTQMFIYEDWYVKNGDRRLILRSL
ncbi:MAG: hypothetical protein PHG49_04035 [Candidatus Pacebacteria bacterium]|nr:hypothetical protein [Candidatus Paceibacterota bacterium]